MIENQKVNGRDATVIYIDKNFKPVDKKDAELIKITYHDNKECIFLNPKKTKK